MPTQTEPTHTVEIIASSMTAVAMVWAGFRYLMQPAFKIAQAEERSKEYKATADAYKTRIDALVASNAILSQQIRAQSALVDEQIKRTDMALLYVADRIAWERRGRVGPAPMMPIALEAALYDLVASRTTPDSEEGRAHRPFTEPPEEGAS